MARITPDVHLRTSHRQLPWDFGWEDHETSSTWQQHLEICNSAALTNFETDPEPVISPDSLQWRRANQLRIQMHFPRTCQTTGLRLGLQPTGEPPRHAPHAERPRAGGGTRAAPPARAPPALAGPARNVTSLQSQVNKQSSKYDCTGQAKPWGAGRRCPPQQVSTKKTKAAGRPRRPRRSPLVLLVLAGVDLSSFRLDAAAASPVGASHPSPHQPLRLLRWLRRAASGARRRRIHDELLLRHGAAAPAADPRRPAGDRPPPRPRCRFPAEAPLAAPVTALALRTLLLSLAFF